MRRIVLGPIALSVFLSSGYATDAGGWGRGPSFRQARKDLGRTVHTGGQVAGTILRDVIVPATSILLSAQAGSLHRNDEAPCTIDEAEQEPVEVPPLSPITATPMGTSGPVIKNQQHGVFGHPMSTPSPLDGAPHEDAPDGSEERSAEPPPIMQPMFD